MDPRPLIPVLLACLGILVLALALRVLQRRQLVEPSKDRVRRGTGHAMLGLREFTEPSVEYVIQAENVEQKGDEDLEADGDDTAAIRDELSVALGRSPIDPEEVRRLLTRAMGRGWAGRSCTRRRFGRNWGPGRSRPRRSRRRGGSPRGGDARRLPERKPIPDAGPACRGRFAVERVAGSAIPRG
jgi:hypothetical protein